MGRRIVVLGGGGFVGSAIVRALALAGFHPVSAHRNPRPFGPGIETCRCDATDPAALRAALRGAQGVVNAVLADGAAMHAAARAVAALGLPRVVHISSMAVYGYAHGLVEESAPLYATTRYAAAKIACESAIGPDATIFRPGIVYGPGGEQWVGRIGRLLRAGRLGDLGPGGDGRCNLIHARDIGAAVVTTLLQPESAGGVFNLATPDPPRWNDVLVAFARAIGAVPVQRIGRKRLALESWLFAPPLHLARRAVRRPLLPDPIPASLVRLFSQDLILDHRRADQLGFRRTRIEDGIAESASWFLDATPPLAA